MMHFSLYTIYLNVETYIFCRNLIRFRNMYPYDILVIVYLTRTTIIWDANTGKCRQQFAFHSAPALGRQLCSS